ncbi:multiple inositol polyphosphate phosphatase 1-like [Sitodiplosis mosellana]|uniref:multiple inositol polyphosphate phosphatase 1-like n=1 Tax=Sitodiplosis mosellana TaxID=263140 RepID=UPI00244461D4|nr:multiple inositol polyphosphate phosphatase 1-like [Sitodiplosis mosellana]XP_055322267.1 multiple inositol polyphosphate phosphatase 1-like [Sitodiplosis mosellana]XP_055322268.1 multiple inositol polyphosphate phosphatase 1-like [Sitodiplosis mosellana]XP_055322270.1 multiple inositol polyphosphate phosphatase 1-like [Sitodiplosis mosellana]XP_055322271.1 multiple inositol polyphosphate phosphatase 1-like [Sitodiplosis mosellana]
MVVRCKSIDLILFICALLASKPINAQRSGECCQEYCYDLDNERPQSAHFASKTSYLIVKGPETGRQYLVPNCNPTKIWIFARHGTRLPEGERMQSLSQLEDLRDEIIANYEKRHSKPAIGAMCENDLDLLKRWHWNQNITAQYAAFLTVQGWEELKFMAIRYQRVFPNILENIYDKNKFLFRYTNTQRTEASYKAFVEGLFGPNAHEHIQVQPPPTNDTLLRPYDYCAPHDMSKSKGDGTEYKKFVKSQTMTQLVSDVSSRLGYKYPLKLQQVMDMFEMCRFDQAWNIGSPSAWCAAFTPTQIDDLEYLEDLQKYYKSSYGRELNSRIQCAAVNDMLHHLETNNLPKTVAYFTHSKAIVLLLTALRFFKDSDSLRADNYYSMSQRKWRSSYILPFASNLVAIKYDCPNDMERDKVMFFLNEKPITDLDWCKVGLCNLADVKERYKKFTQANCDEYYCTDSGASSILASIILPLIAMILHKLAA